MKPNSRTSHTRAQHFNPKTLSNASEMAKVYGFSETRFAKSCPLTIHHHHA